MSISDLTVALSIARELKAEDLSVMVAINLANALLYSGEFERALAAVEALDKRVCGNPLWLYQLQWVKGAPWARPW